MLEPPDVAIDIVQAALGEGHPIEDIAWLLDADVDEIIALLPPPAPTGRPATPKSRRRRRRSRERAPKTVRPSRREMEYEVIYDDSDRPRTRADCVNDRRPCPWVACKYHLYLDVNPETGSIKLNFPDREPWEIPETCALDIADEGGATLERVASLVNLTRERIRQIESEGAEQLGFDDELRSV